MNGYYYYSIASGSKGNAGLFITPSCNILIDMGISYRYLNESLKKHNIDKIDAILITHEHIDHVRGLKTLTKYTDIPVFITKTSHNVISDTVNSKNVRFFEPNSSFFIDNFEIKSFRTPHDSRESVGFFITDGKVNFAYATDLGFMPQSIFDTIKQADFLVLESNYDKIMLEFGPYPYPLKKRIASNEGHLSNHESAKCVCDLISCGVSQIILAHLSENNNTPKNVADEITNTLAFYKICGKIGENIHIAPVKNDYPLIKIWEEVACLI